MRSWSRSGTGEVANRPLYAAIGVTVDGGKDVLGLWSSSGGESAKFWLSVLTDLKNRGVRDVFFLVCDGLKGLPEAVGNVWPLAVVQTCIIHLIRNTFRLASRKDADAIKRDIKPIYTAPNADTALVALDELEEKWGDKYGAMIRLWRNAWNEFVPFLDYDVEIRKVICSTNAIVIWSGFEGVLDVRDERLRSGDSLGGRGYLRPSITRILWRFDACSAGGGACLAA
jgi:transposase-like protein